MDSSRVIGLAAAGLEEGVAEDMETEEDAVGTMVVDIQPILRIQQDSTVIHR
jgi:hypothetical protein